MVVKDKEKSLLELAIDLLQKKRKPQKISAIIKEVMEIKGYKVAQVKEERAQFVLDFMQSGYFVYCGDDCWDLKERQPTSILDKDGGDYEDIFFDEDVKKNELKDDFESDVLSVKEDFDDKDDDDEEEDELAKEFDSIEDDIEDADDKELAVISEDDFETEDEEEDEFTEDDFE